MRKEIVKYSVIFLTISMVADCRKSYAPPEITAKHMYLTVDGSINMNANGVTGFKLTRSQMLSDTVPSVPELGATVSIQTTSGSVNYQLNDIGSNGIYISDPLTLDMNQQYILSIIRANGEKCASDPITPKQTPPIDSVSWTIRLDGITQTQALYIVVNTHDPANNTHFYRWDFTETWEHDAQEKTYYIVKNGIIEMSPDTSFRNWHCWNYASSTDLLLGSSAGLSADVISQAPIERIYQNDQRLDLRYSILVRQYALDAPGYDYWVLVQKQSQKLGGLFDIQPGQLTGNMHDLKDAGEPVYGYISASTFQEQRIFINNQDLPGWQPIPIQCTEKVFYPDSIPGDSLWYRRYSNLDPNYTFYEFSRGIKNKRIQLFKSTACFDCTFQGGSTIKPPFW